MPIHGEFYMLKTHAKSAIDCGIKPENVFILENGKILNINENGAKVLSKKVPAKDILIDGTDVGGVNTAVIEERKQLSQRGMVTTVITLDSKGKILVKPTIISKGFLFAKDNESVFESIEDYIEKYFDEIEAKAVNKESIINDLKEKLLSHIKKICRQNPMVFIILNFTNIEKGIKNEKEAEN